MDLQDAQRRALAIREKYEAFELKTVGRVWTRAELVQGLVGDIGDLVTLTMVKDGARAGDAVEERLQHEIADCLWSLLVIAKKYDVDIEAAFVRLLTELDRRLSAE